MVCGLVCDCALVQQYTPSVFMLLTIYDLGSLALITTVPSSQVFVCWCSILTGSPSWSGFKADFGCRSGCCSFADAATVP